MYTTTLAMSATPTIRFGVYVSEIGALEGAGREHDGQRDAADCDERERDQQAR
jgi:hypothetical protein